MSSALSCSLDNDSLANIFSFLEWQELFKVRVVCTKWKEATTITLVPIIDITTQVQANALSTITKCLPNTKSFVLDFGNPDTQYFKIRPGDGFDGSNTDFDHYSTDDSVVDISSIQNLTNLGTLSLRHTGLKGRYDYLFHLEQLQHLDLTWNPLLRWDLKQLPPNLKTLRCSFSHNLRGDLKDLKNMLRRNQLQVLVLAHCTQVTGSLEDLYDFVSLEALDIDGNRNISGDITKIDTATTFGVGDLPSIKQLRIGPGIYGGGDEFQSIQEVPSLMIARYNLMKCRSINILKRRWRLSRTSPDYYNALYVHVSRRPPFYVEFVNIGNARMGWRWTNGGGAYGDERCEINWIDPEPTVEKNGQESVVMYRVALHEDRQKYIRLYQGLFQPPTEIEYKRRLRETPLDRAIAKATIIPTNWGVW